MDLSVSGLSSGFDWKTLVAQLTDVERAPERRMQYEQSKLQIMNNAYTSLKTELSVLQGKVEVLKDPALFNSRLTATSDATIAAATADSDTPLGDYSFNFQQLATAAAQQGLTNTGAAISATSDVSGVLLGGANFSSTVTAGDFTVNGRRVTVATSDTLQQVFDAINAATGGAVTAGYDPATDKITLSSAGEIVLGSATDTSNFLQAARLANNGTGTVSSSLALGSVRLDAVLAHANFATALTDGGGGAGEFKINGVSIRFNTTTDRASDVLQRINDSAAGVTAGYDFVNDRFVLTNRSTGDVGLALEDVTGNFLAATGLTTGTLERGTDLIYTVNGGGQLTSHSNTVKAENHGITGLTVDALKAPATVTISVTSDTGKIKTAITDFITAYNKAQSFIDAQTASTTDAQGRVTAGVLQGQSDANEIASRLRSLANARMPALTGLLKQLAEVGIESNGNDNSIAMVDESKLDAALTDNLTDVTALFTDATNGLAVGLGGYLDKTVGDDGSLSARQDNLTQQSSSIDTQVADLERVVLANKQRLTDSFVAMELAEQRINQQLQFLQQRFGASSSSAG